jgi:hypothetical protein
MAEFPIERRRSWSRTDRERIQQHEADWIRRPTVEEIRDQHHDECSQIVRPVCRNVRSKKLKRAVGNAAA